MPSIQQLVTAQGARLAPAGYQQITALDSAQNISAPAGTDVAIIQSLGGNARIMFLPPAATVGTGQRIVENDTIQFSGPFSGITVIADSENPATEINIT